MHTFIRVVLAVSVGRCLCRRCRRFRNSLPYLYIVNSSSGLGNGRPSRDTPRAVHMEACGKRASVSAFCVHERHFGLQNVCPMP